MTDDQAAARIAPVPFADALGDRYLAYALSTITARSLPDVRDGLKPVHRRLLYAMRQLRLSPGQAPKKSARVVGDVIGQYHPHGEVAVYDALVRLAQDFAQRWPLVDGHGNFGSVDGDNAAAQRYTEARLTEVAEALLDGIDEDTVDFRETYDGGTTEPVVLPGGFPNLLANGAQGIAVGMATSIPPHNLAELAAGLLALIAEPGLDPDRLLDHVPGPDFPTGGELVETREAIAEAYRTGRGSFRLRARWTVEKLGQGTWQAVVTEIPYQVPKARLIERIAELIGQKKVPLLADVRDESAADIRIVLEPRARTVDPGVLMEHLFRTTDLETRVPLNMNVLDARGVPRLMTLHDAMRAFLDHRHDVLQRRLRYRLARIEHRLEVLDGYLIAYLNLDEIIRIIREEDQPKVVMMARFGLTDVQAEAILDMRLRALRRLEELEIRREHKTLSDERREIRGLLKDEAARWGRIADEIRGLAARFGPETALGRRRTALGEAPTAEIVPLEAMVAREPITVYLSEKGWVRAVRGHQAETAEVRYKDGDRERFVIPCETTDRLVVFATNGRFYTLGADRVPRGRGFGEPVRLSVDLPNDSDILDVLVHVPGRRLLVAAADGRGFVVREDDVVAQTRAGKQVLNLAAGGEAALCRVADGDHVAVVGTHRRMLVFPLDEVPEMARGRGVILQRYKGATLADLRVFRAADGLSWTLGSRTRTETDLTPWLGRRGAAGRLPPKGFPQSGRFG